jgi:hypothetical protein
VTHLTAPHLACTTTRTMCALASDLCLRLTKAVRLNLTMLPMQYGVGSLAQLPGLSVVAADRSRRGRVLVNQCLDVVNVFKRTLVPNLTSAWSRSEDGQAAAGAEGAEGAECPGTCCMHVVHSHAVGTSPSPNLAEPWSSNARQQPMLSLFRALVVTCANTLTHISGTPTS